MRENGIDYLRRINRERAAVYTSPAAIAARRLYEATFRVAVCMFKCMDGRLDGAKFTEAPPGIIVPWRNIGARFDLSWPTGFKADVANWYDHHLALGHACLAIATYHYSRGSEGRGCAGFSHNTPLARASAFRFREQLEHVFGRGAGFYPIVIGMETDLDAFVVHGKTEDRSLDLGTFSGSDQDLEKEIRALDPEMPDAILSALLYFLQGNLRHIAEIRAADRPLIDIEHKEWVIAVGRGFYWMHEPNTALIIGPYDPDLVGTVERAGKIVLANRERLEREGALEHPEIVLVTSAPWRDEGHDRRGAELKSQWLNQFAFDTLRERVPDVLPYLQRLTATINVDNWGLDILDRA